MANSDNRSIDIIIISAVNGEGMGGGACHDMMVINNNNVYSKVTL